MAKTIQPYIQPYKVGTYTMDAVSEWFIKSGKIKTASKLNLNKPLISYGIAMPEIVMLSKHVADYVAKETGYHVKLPSKWAQFYVSGTVADYTIGVTAKVMSALPGDPDDSATVGPFPD